MKFKLNQKVMINDLNIKGRILEISISRTATYYRVRYFYDGKLNDFFLLGEELKSIE